MGRISIVICRIFGIRFMRWWMMRGLEERYRFDPYGVRTVTRNDATIDEHYGFTGRYHDDSDVTRLIYFRNRWMSGEMGRWISRDPIGYVDGLNLYCAYFVPMGTDPTSQ